jgi:hypothetical protein
MMPMPGRRKARQMEKVEILCRTAIAGIFIPSVIGNTFDHACAIPGGCTRSDFPTVCLNADRPRDHSHRFRNQAKSAAARSRWLAGFEAGWGRAIRGSQQSDIHCSRLFRNRRKTAFF